MRTLVSRAALAALAGFAGIAFAADFARANLPPRFDDSPISPSELSCRSSFRDGEFRPVRAPIVLKAHFAWLQPYADFRYPLYSKVLILGDGNKGQGVTVKAGASRGQLIVTTDIGDFPGLTVRADNNQLPFKPESFELIVMNRGLCPCQSPTVSCGGILGERFAYKQFLTQIADLLDSKSDRNLALMTGYNFGPLEKLSENVWVKTVYEFQAEHPELQVVLIEGGNNHHFLGVAMSRSETLKVKQILRDLTLP